METVNNVSKSIYIYNVVLNEAGTENKVVSEDLSIKFETSADLEMFLQDYCRVWEKRLRKKLTVAQKTKETMSTTEIKKIFRLAAIYHNYPIQKVLSKKRQVQYVVDVKRQAILICVNLHYSLSEIGRAINHKHDLVIYHRDKCRGFIETDPDYARRFKDMEEHIMETIHGKYKYNEDGSGETLKT